MKISLPWRRQPDPPAADPEPPRRPAPQPDPTDPQTDAAIRQISEIARHWIDIAGAQAQEIARLRAQLAEQEAALQQLQRNAATLAAENEQIRRVAIHWHTTAEAQRRAALPAVWAHNAARYISRN
jgi:hypothetical protein